MGSRVAALFGNNSLLRVSPLLQTKSSGFVLFQRVNRVLQEPLVIGIVGLAFEARKKRSHVSTDGQSHARLIVA
jgi:hypothetical protein